MANPKSKLVFYIPLFTAFVTLTIFFLALLHGWLGQPAQVGTDFGEASHPGLIKQPVNTYSSLGFVLAGLWIGWRLMRHPTRQNANSFTQSTFFSTAFASLVVCLGPGSMAMHATESHIGGDLDLLSMYLVAAFLTAYSVKRFFRLSRTWFLLLFGTVAVLCVSVQDLHYSTPFVDDFGQFIFGFFIIIAGLFELLNILVRKFKHDLKWGALYLGCLLLAFLIWKLSLNKIPSYSLLQGHAIWHLLCAVSAYCLFQYYASEKPARLSPQLAGSAQESPLALGTTVPFQPSGAGAGPADFFSAKSCNV